MPWHRPAALAAPPVVLLFYLAAAFAIGTEHSCTGGLEFYAALGLLTLPVLVVAPCLAWPGRTATGCCVPCWPSPASLSASWPGRWPSR